MRTIDGGRPGQGRRVLDYEGRPAACPMGNPDGRLSLYPEDAANLAHGTELEKLVRTMLLTEHLDDANRELAEELLGKFEETRRGLGGDPMPDDVRPDLPLAYA